MRIYSWSLTVGLIALIPGSCALPGPRPSLGLRAGRPENHTLNRERADAVKAAFTSAWDGYYHYCFPHDELHPVTNTCGDSRYGCLITQGHP